MIIRTKEDFYKAKKNLPEIITFDGELARVTIKTLKEKKPTKKAEKNYGFLSLSVLMRKWMFESLVITKDEIMELLNHYDFKIQAGDNIIEGKRKD